jgi:hypothetical protein
MAHIIHINDLKPGDVLLCFSSIMGEEQRAATGSKYSHAVIYLGDSMTAESATRGVKKTGIAALLEDYEHLAVFREPHNWNAERIATLRRFVEQAIAAKAKFNFDGFRNFAESQAEHQRDLTENLARFFDGKLSPLVPGRQAYFCSEFVAAAFIAVGIVGPGAALVFDPRVISPGSLKDPTYGLFVGYLIPYDGYEIPINDEFIATTPLREIWPEKVEGLASRW